MHAAEAEKKEIAERMGSCHREGKYGPRGKGIMMELWVRFVSKH
jgi:hypothetical protein